MSRNEFRSEYQEYVRRRERRELIARTFAWLAIGIVISILVVLAFRAWEFAL